MTVIISGITNGNRTLTYTLTRPSQKLLDGTEDAARYLFDVLGQGNHGTIQTPRTFADLTNAEKLALIDANLTEGLKALVQAMGMIDYKKAYIPPEEL